MRLLYHSTGAPAGELSQDDLVDLYRHPAPAGRGVWLRSNFAASLDGAIAGPDGRSGSINTVSDSHVFALHRAHADAILVGAQTVRTEGYRAVDLAPWQRDLRAAEGLADFPSLAIVTRTLDLDPTLATNAALEVGRVVIFTTAGKSSHVLAPYVEAGIEVIAAGDDRVDLVGVARQLADRGLTRVLCEGGPRLHRDLLASALLNEMSLTLAPLAVGGVAGRTTAGEWLPRSQFRLNFALHDPDETVFLNYRRP